MGETTHRDGPLLAEFPGYLVLRVSVYPVNLQFVSGPKHANKWTKFGEET